MNLPKKMDKSWFPYLKSHFEENLTNPIYFFKEKILPKIQFYPKIEDIFNVFQMPIEDIKVVILGQDPYPQPNQAIGYAFAVSEETPIPKSLGYIHTEIGNEYLDEDGYETDDAMIHPEFVKLSIQKWKTLSHWTKQGVFLLNTALTVEKGKAGSHLVNWSPFISDVIKIILSKKRNCIWVLWGNKAQQRFFHIYKNSFVNSIPIYILNNNEKIDKIVGGQHYILQAAHPAAEAYNGGNAGFLGCNHFKIINEILEKQNKPQIMW